jgi:aminoglycoside phosphotransferase (APT) family kinase protein
MSNRIRTAVIEALRDRYGDGAAIEQLGRTSQREWSWQTNVRAGGVPNPDLLVKVPRWADAPTLESAMSADEQPAIVAEFDMLSAIAEAVDGSGDPGLTKVEPIAYLPAINGMLMQRLEGQPLRSSLRFGVSAATAETLFRRAGRLAAVVHGIGAPQRRPFDGRAASTTANGLAAAAATVAPGVLEESLQQIAAAAVTLDGIDEPTGTVHGDLNLGNVLVDRVGRVAVIDPNPTEGPRQLPDVARLSREIRFDKRRLATAGWISRGSPRDLWAEAFEEGTGTADEPMLPFYRALELGEKWLRIETDTRGLRRVGLLPARRLLRRGLRQSVAALDG